MWQRAKHLFCWVSSGRSPAHRSSGVQGESPRLSFPGQTSCQQPWTCFSRTFLLDLGMQPQQERPGGVAQRLKHPWGKGVVTCPGQGSQLFPLRPAPPSGEHSQGEFLLRGTVRDNIKPPPGHSTDQLPGQVRAATSTQQLLPENKHVGNLKSNTEENT